MPKREKDVHAEVVALICSNSRGDFLIAQIKYTILLNLLSPPAGDVISECSNAVSAYVSISRFRETKREMDV